MATNVTHIVLADSVFEDLFSDCDKRNFMLGTLLPDIRYLDKTIPRDKYHIKNITLDDVLTQKDCFTKGIYFHSLLDQIRDEFYISRGIYVFGGDEEFILALKLFEDQYLYGKIKNRDEYLTWFDNIPYQKAPDIRKESLDKRYTISKDLLYHTPDNVTRRSFQVGLGLTEAETNKINDDIAKIAKDEKLLTVIDELYDSFLSLITSAGKKK